MLPQFRHIFNSRKWRRARALALRHSRGLCVECRDRRGLVVAAREVHHRRPLEKGGAPYDPRNLQPLCFECHRQKHRHLRAEAGKAAKRAREGPVPGASAEWNAAVSDLLGDDA